MPTERQKKLAKALVENALSDKPKTAGELLENAGYDKTTALSSPGRTIEQKGVQEAVIEVSKTMLDALEKKGITPDYLAQRLEALLASDNPKAISSGLGHAFKLGAGGGYAADKSVNVNVNVDVVDDEAVDKLAEVLNQKMKDVHQRTDQSSNGEVTDSLDSEVQDQE